MFANSTQLKYWTFCGTTELSRLREEANKKYISKHAADFEVRLRLYFREKKCLISFNFNVLSAESSIVFAISVPKF